MKRFYYTPTKRDFDRLKLLIAMIPDKMIRDCNDNEHK